MVAFDLFLLWWLFTITLVLAFLVDVVVAGANCPLLLAYQSVGNERVCGCSSVVIALLGQPAVALAVFCIGGVLQ